ncbi:hypothetical protein PG997_004157 [Apiospora hydei]|uniref:Uncharacterized protein n=1 Tax=Apiospora hydei TaxID=1337664 RepID=A0ABR1X191_9PEZI
MPSFPKPSKCQGPALAEAELPKAPRDMPLGMVHCRDVSQNPPWKPTGNAQTVGCQHVLPSKPASRSTRPKQPSGGNDTHGKENMKPVVNQPNKKKKTTTQRRRHQSRKGSPPPPHSRNGNTRPSLPPSSVLIRQGDTLNRELDRVLRNGKMLFWQENIFTDAFRKIRKALLELGRREEKGVPTTETENHARAYARQAFDRFKICMEKA